jgi:hypothetical protein
VSRWLAQLLSIRLRRRVQQGLCAVMNQVSGQKLLPMRGLTAFVLVIIFVSI